MTVQNPTNVADIAVPVEMVKLEHLKTKAGEPVWVRCEALDETIITDIARALPGELPAGEKSRNTDPERNIREVLRMAPALIEAGTVLVGPDGAEIRPAFYFTAEAHRRSPLSLPGHPLRVADKIALCEAIMRLGGYVGGAAGAGFHAQEHVGREGGAGTVEAGEVRVDGAAPPVPRESAEALEGRG